MTDVLLKDEKTDSDGQTDLGKATRLSKGQTRVLVSGV